ncbi:MAG: hypothetical protein NZM04_05485 [Methylacidiphilales bacterium]|nr:hypothetical protein [Candidatus Methylacidiphilales bacterium]
MLGQFTDILRKHFLTIILFIISIVALIMSQINSDNNSNTAESKWEKPVYLDRVWDDLNYPQEFIVDLSIPYTQTVEFDDIAAVNIGLDVLIRTYTSGNSRYERVILSAEIEKSDEESFLKLYDKIDQLLFSDGWQIKGECEIISNTMRARIRQCLFERGVSEENQILFYILGMSDNLATLIYYRHFHRETNES